MANAKENAYMDHNMDDDELAGLPVTKRLRVTPRSSMAAQEAKPTPYADLRALAGLIRRPSTPAQRRPSSAGTAFSTGKGASDTPLLQLRTTPRVRRPLQPIGPGGSNPTTPHTIRALRQRRATPGQDRRKSGRTKRETPRDALRNLSKILAKTTQPTRPSPGLVEPGSGLVKQQRADDFEDELSPEQPKFTIAVDNEEDESSLLSHPRLSIPLEEGEQTAKSIEMPRRALIGDEQERLLRGNFGTLRASDQMDILGESLVEYSHGDVDEDRQWLDIENGIGNVLGVRESEADISQLIRDNSEQPDELSSGHVERSIHTTAFSPFVLKIPDTERQDRPVPSPIYGNLLTDDVLQFGSPLPVSDVNIPPFQRPSTVQRPAPKAAAKPKSSARARKALKVSRHGISYSGLPTGIIKSLATTFARSVGNKTACLSKETTSEILEASDRFFKQLGGDLAATSSHAGRKIVDESDVVTVMRRQRQVSARASAFFLGSRYLPSETLKEMRMPVPNPNRRRKRLPLEDIAEDWDEERA